MSSSPRLGLAYLSPHQAQKHVTVNEALRRLDALVQPSVKSRGIAAEPAGPTEGDAYILPAGPTGAAWSAMAANDLAVFQDGAWALIVPKTGWIAYVEDEAKLYVRLSGGSWARTETVRERLTANRTYHVRTDGSDANTGLIDSAGGAFLTLQKAMNVVAGLDLDGFTATVEVASGTYGAGVAAKTQTTGPVAFKAKTAGAAILSTAGGLGVVGGGVLIALTIDGFKFENCSHGVLGLGAGCNFAVKNCSFGAGISIQIRASSQAAITLSGANAISAGASYALLADTGAVIALDTQTTTLTGAPVFTAAFAEATGAGSTIRRSGSVAYSGSAGATTVRYNANLNAVIDTGASGASFFPGTVAGTTATGGQYA